MPGRARDECKHALGEVGRIWSRRQLEWRDVFREPTSMHPDKAAMPTTPVTPDMPIGPNIPARRQIVNEPRGQSVAKALRGRGGDGGVELAAGCACGACRRAPICYDGCARVTSAG